MNIDPDQLPPPPADPRHHRFAVLVSQGRYLVDAYLMAGFQCSRATAYVNGHRLSLKPEVADYIAAICRAEHEARAAAREKERKAEAERHSRELIASLMRRRK